jgi:hypothetical protein
MGRERALLEDGEVGSPEGRDGGGGGESMTIGDILRALLGDRRGMGEGGAGGGTISSCRPQFSSIDTCTWGCGLGFGGSGVMRPCSAACCRRTFGGNVFFPRHRLQ